MDHLAPVERVVDLLNPTANVLLNMSLDEARTRVASGRPERVAEIEGQFALLARDGKVVRMARSIGRPMRYFLAKRAEGPCLVVAERIDEIHRFLGSENLADQFHSSYTRMVPAHYVVELALLGCPDPNPTNTRFFTPERNRLGTDLDEIGRAYIGALSAALDRWLDRIESREPLGVLFSGGIDSGAVLLVLYHRLLARGESPARLKAFTLAVDGGGDDLVQAQQFLAQLGLGFLLEAIDVPRAALDYRQAVATTEDYKPLDVEAATMTLALCRGIRQLYPD
jgi:asparagine synthase (glutamine-hydrolysing)